MNHVGCAVRTIELGTVRTAHPTVRNTVALLLALFAGQAVAHGGEDHSHDAQPVVVATQAGATGNPQRLADGSVFVPKPAQRRLGLRTQLAATEALAVTLSFNGTVIADPNASGRVQAIQPGRIEPGPRGLPVIGQKVRKGEVLAWLKPVASSLERGNQQALLAELEAEFAIAERRVRRLDQLEGAVPQKEIEAAHFELAALKKRRAAIGASLAAPESLRAPVTGVISATQAVAGQVVEAREVLFEVIDPARLAVEALSYEASPNIKLNDAVAQFPAGSVPLHYVGASRQLREQAMPLLFRVASVDAPLAIGQPVKVIAKTASRIDGIAVPHAALVKNAAGDDVVWLHTAPESFTPRVVKWTPLDANRVAVGSGLKDGDRIVVAGASLLAQVR
jgi:RND family efflux transporter MFP subunit